MQLVDERARGVLGAPRAGAPGGGQHDRAAAAAGQAHLGVVPVADARVVGIAFAIDLGGPQEGRSEEHTSELQSLMRISYAVFCLKTTNPNNTTEYYIVH